MVQGAGDHVSIADDVVATDGEAAAVDRAPATQAPDLDRLLGGRHHRGIVGYCGINRDRARQVGIGDGVKDTRVRHRGDDLLNPREETRRSREHRIDTPQDGRILNRGGHRWDGPAAKCQSQEPRRGKHRYCRECGPTPGIELASLRRLHQPDAKGLAERVANAVTDQGGDREDHVG